MYANTAILGSGQFWGVTQFGCPAKWAGTQGAHPSSTDTLSPSSLRIPVANLSRGRRQSRLAVMTIPNNKIHDLPAVTTDAMLQDRVTELLTKANQRQFWMMFLDDEAKQIPALIPVDNIPIVPGPEGRRNLPEMLSSAMEATQAASLVLVLERYASSALTPADCEWALSLHNACDQEGIPLRGILLAHRSGIRWIAQDDYRF